MTYRQQQWKDPSDSLEVERGVCVRVIERRFVKHAGYQEARENEEDIDSEEAEREKGREEVEEDHDEHCPATQTLGEVANQEVPVSQGVHFGVFGVTASL